MFARRPGHLIIVDRMPRLHRVADQTAVSALAGAQAGAVSRAQLLGLGMTDDQIARELHNKRWQPSGLEGIYVTFTGPIDYLTRCWAALLYAGEGATLCLETAEWFWGLRDEPPPDIHVMIPADRRVVRQPGVRIHIRVHLTTRRHPARQPPVTTVEDTVLDRVERADSASDVIDIVSRACQRRRTTTDRLEAAAPRRKKLRYRALLLDVLAEVRDGVQSALERRYRRDVERAHGLPRGERNRPEGRSGRRRYRDVRYRRFGVVVELDGSAAHPAEARDRDDIRDNALVEEERTRTLRYGWHPVAGRPCETAGQVGRVLQRGGWSGAPVPCGPGCPVNDGTTA